MTKTKRLDKYTEFSALRKLERNGLKVVKFNKTVLAPKGKDIGQSLWGAIDYLGLTVVRKEG